MLSLRRRRPGDAPVSLEVGLGLREKVPVPHRLRNIVVVGGVASVRDPAPVIHELTFVMSTAVRIAAVVVLRTTVCLGSLAATLVSSHQRPLSD